MDLDEQPVARRRRGAELEQALLEATWAELTEVGYGALTFNAVAQRAGTSRTVVYRRWPTKRELTEATITFCAVVSSSPNKLCKVRPHLATAARAGTSTRSFAQGSTPCL